MQTKKRVLLTVCFSFFACSLVNMHAMQRTYNWLTKLRKQVPNAYNTKKNFTRADPADYPTSFPATIRAKILFSINQNPERAQTQLAIYQNFYGPNFLSIVLKYASTNQNNQNIETIKLVNELKLEKLKQLLKQNNPKYDTSEDALNNLLLEAIENEDQKTIEAIFEDKELLEQITFTGFHEAKGRAIEINNQETLKVFDILISKEMEKLKKKKPKKKVYDI
ncbi:MAG: hypothetical protein ABH827_01355 [bacterium]